MTEGFINKIEESGLITINLEDYYPSEEIVLFDLKDYLFMGLILKEKEFREALKQIDLSVYKDKLVAVTCSADAIIPIWAYMLIGSLLQPVVKELYYGTANQIQQQILLKNIDSINAVDYIEKRVVIKGCGDLPIGEAAYLQITQKLRPAVKSIMYGEPCSTVPIYKKK